MLVGLFALLACQLAGEVITRGLGLPIPGPVIGIVLLFVILATHGRLRGPAAAEGGDIAKAADGLLANLGLVFIPAGVGVSQHYQLVLDNGLPLIVALLVSTVLTLMITVLVYQGVDRWLAARRGKP
jgi:putative effector of murein hydrolase LrgA (UPF0299 family)